MSAELDEDERAVLWAALTATDDRAEQARRFGDALRSLGAPRPSVNEAYRSAFYSGDRWPSMSDNPLFAYFAANRSGTPLDKWVHYFPIYERHLAPFRGSAARLLEIGVYRGGGLDLFRHHLGPDARIVGIDRDESARTVSDRHPVEIGDQADREFLEDVAERHGPFDIVIDDGGHTMDQQIRSIETLFPRLADGGVYIVEDTHTSYWREYSDPADPGSTFIAWTKDRIDDLHAYHHSTELDLEQPWQTDLAAIHAYDSLIVFDKARRDAPFSEVSGTSDYINVDREASAANIELLATRQAALDRLQLEAESQVDELTTRANEAAQASDDELRILRAELMAAGQQTARMRTELDLTREELDDTSNKLLGSWEIIREMRQSRSWQLTGPLRAAKSIIRRR